MKTTHRSIIDDRGYIFVLPSLGLPDVSGEWHILKAAIGTKARATPALNDATTSFPLREADSDDLVIEVEYGQAIWHLPILEPQTPLKDPEVFTLSVKRSRVSATPALQAANRFTVQDGMQLVCLQPPRREIGVDVFTGKTSEEDDAAGRGREKKVGGKYGFVQSVKKENSRSASSFSVNSGFASFAQSGEDQDETQQDDSEANIEGRADDSSSQSSSSTSSEDDSDHEWSHTEEDAFRDSWYVDLYLELLEAAMRNGSELPPANKLPGARLRVHPAEDHDYRSMDYIVRLEGDDSPARGEEEWKPLPERATKKGVQRSLVNAVRVYKGREPIGKEEWQEMMKAK